MKQIGASIPETGAALGGLSRATVYRLINARYLVAYKVGSRTMVTIKSIEDYAADAPRLGA